MKPHEVDALAASLERRANYFEGKVSELADRGVADESWIKVVNLARFAGQRDGLREAAQLVRDSS